MLCWYPPHLSKVCSWGLVYTICFHPFACSFFLDVCGVGELHGMYPDEKKLRSIWPVKPVNIVPSPDV